jgi:hypothetical protein
MYSEELTKQPTNFCITKIDASKMRPKGEGHHSPNQREHLNANRSKIGVGYAY